MRFDKLILTLFTTFVLGIASASAQVRINEVGYAGVDFQGSSTWVELHNTSMDEIDVSTYWLCNFPSYEQIANLTVITGSTTVPAGGFLVVDFGSLGVGDGEVGLYTSADFGSADAMVDYMQYGSAGHQREGVAVQAGVWEASAFVPASATGQSLAFVGGGATAAENWTASDPTPGMGNPMDPDVAPEALVDRFAEGTGTLLVRDDTNGLPEAGEPIDFDQGEPFITRGLGPDGQSVQYYNFDVMPRETAPIFVLFREGEDTPVEGQLNIIDVIPGDEGYNDFWHVHKVTVPADYLANTVTSLDALMAAGYPIERTNMVVNCPIVPAGSTATLRYRGENDAGLVRGWYQGQVVYYFDFSERMLTVELPPAGHPTVPVSPIYVSFNINPGEAGGGPPSGFMAEAGSDQTHNVVATLPEDEAYSPLWSVNIYDNAEFGAVHDLASAGAATLLAADAALVNCPIVSLSGRDPDVAPEALVDRFAEGTGTLLVRDDTNGLPEAGEPIDFDQGEPFITRGLGPDGQSVQYYNFDVMPRETAPIFVLFREGEDTPVEGQLNIIDVIPGDEGYNDFWHVHKVTVPADYLANTVTSLDALMAAGYPIERTNMVVNCPIVPAGSAATLRYRGENDAGLVRGWYQGQVVYYFDFSERMLTVELPPAGHPTVPVSPIYVSFNINPGEAGGGPPSGFMAEAGSDQTHNVVATLPEDEAYSPLWSVNIYDNAEFGAVHDLASAGAATLLAADAALVNCPIVSIATDVAVEPLPDEVPTHFALQGNYPNPFNPQTTIRYSLDEAGAVTLRVFDLLGRKVVDLVDGQQARGVYQVTWDGRDAFGQRVATGIYLYRLSLNGQLSEVRKMTVLK